jgi:hypothetical protein
MPEDSDEKKQSELSLGDPSGGEQSLPPVVPPTTKTPFQFNQQINIQQIPPRAWEKLSADQIVDLTKTIMTQIEKTDERQFKWAIDQNQTSAKTQRYSLIVGGLIAVLGVGGTVYLAAQGVLDPVLSLLLL